MLEEILTEFSKNNIRNQTIDPRSWENSKQDKYNTHMYTYIHYTNYIQNVENQIQRHHFDGRKREERAHCKQRSKD